MSLVRAKRGFVVFDRSGVGMPRRIKQGSILESTDPAVVASPTQFEVLEDMVVRPQPAVERASAEPGERRSVDTTTGVKPVEKVEQVEQKPAADRSTNARRSPVKMDTTAGPKGKQDGEV
jgi:hypothetical protein